MKHITDIFFDLDHTLWDFDKNSKVAFEKIFETKHFNIDVETFIKVYAPINQAFWKLYQNDKITSEELRYQRLKQSFDALDSTISDSKIDEIANEYIQLLPQNNHLFEGALDVLSYLKTNYKLHIITNGFEKVQLLKIQNAGLSTFFSTITNSEMAGVKKPNPKIFELALTLAKTQKNTSIMIGDCIEADVEGAIQFGMEAIWFNSEKINSATTKYQIQNLNQLKNIF